MRSIAQQSVEDLGGSGSVLVRQKQDHVALDELLDQLQTAGGQDQQAVLARTCRLVFPHAFAEEAVLWPVVRRRLPDGEHLTLRVEQEHQEINELFGRLDATALDEPTRPALMRRIVDLLRQDIRDEEDDLLPRLRECLEDKELRRLGRRWELVRRIAPTRHHPIVARRPPGNLVAALPLTVLDRTRDRFDRAARHAQGGPSRALRLASHGLGEVARRLERLHMMRAGERPETRVDHAGDQR